MTLTRFPLRRGTASAVMVEYGDAQGDRSMRQVMPIAIISDERRRSADTTYLQARCSIAKATRSFRFDRIESLNDPATGEEYSTTDWLAGLKLGDGRAFTWADEDADEHAAAAMIDMAVAEANRPGPPRGRSMLFVLLLGYVVGRLRLIHLALVALDVRHGWWL